MRRNHHNLSKSKYLQQMMMPINHSMQHRSRSSLLGCSPLKPVSQRDKHSYAKRKVQGLQKAVTSKVAKVLNVPTEELPSTEMKTTCEKCEDLDKFIELQKEMCHHASRKEKIT